MNLSLAASQPPLEESGGTTPVPLLATVPAPSGTKRLHFFWGLGNRISLCPLAESPSAAGVVDGSDDFDAEVPQQRRPAAHAANVEPPSASVVQW